MPTATYDLIEEKVLGSAAASVTFSSIPGTYKDLVLECYIKMGDNGFQPRIQINGDTNTNYSTTSVFGNGTTANSTRHSNNTYFYPTPGTGIAANDNLTWIVQLQSYSNTSVNKTLLGRMGTAGGSVSAGVHLWRSSSAITSILVGAESGTFGTGSYFRLWGVAG